MVQQHENGFNIQEKTTSDKSNQIEVRIILKELGLRFDVSKNKSSRDLFRDHSLKPLMLSAEIAKGFKSPEEYLTAL